jgi:hypothetical protein
MLAQPEESESTMFSTEPFVNAWISGLGGGWHPISVSVGSGLSKSVMYGVAVRGRWGYSSAQFGPAGLYANLSPFPACFEERINDAIREFQRKRLLSVTWNVRFDHDRLAAAMRKAGHLCKSGTTHVIPLLGDHEVVFSHYRPTRRNEIRQCHRKGVQIRRALGYEDVIAYCQVHERLAQQKEGFNIKYPTSLICELVKLREHVILLVAEYEGKIIAGSLFFVDGDSMMYWHGASDRDYSRLFASGALVDRGIQIACEKGCQSFNMGGSCTDALREFKTSFGAAERTVYAFTVALNSPLPFRIVAKVRNCLHVH